MATVRQGNQPALMIVDVQVDVAKNRRYTPRVLRNLVSLVDRARKARVPVIWNQHHDAELPHGSAGWQWVAELNPADHETLIHKQHNSAFEQTELEAKLAALGVTHIVLAGLVTNWCIRATAYATLERGYDLTLVEDAHTTGDIALADGSRIDAASIINDLNLVMSGVSYPGRHNRTRKAAELDFAQLGASST